MKLTNLTNDCDALLVTSKSNLYYLTKYANADAAAIITGQNRFYFTDKRYLEDARAKLLDWEVVDIDNISVISKCANFVAKNNVQALGIEEDDLTAKRYLYFKKMLPKLELIPVDEKFSALRTIKSEDEIAIMKEAQSVTDVAFSKVLSRVREGVTERQLSADLEYILKQEGAEELAFPNIVAFGENTSKPHAVPSERALKKRDFITLDFGAKFKGYCADMTRTIAFHSVTNEMSDYYYLVLEAQIKSIAAAKAGIFAKDLDAVARKVFKENHVEERFLHSLGHSLGIDIHESIKISKNSDDILKENMVYSIEPGLYFEGKFGVRIEDVVIQRKSDVENLTNSEKQLIIIQ